MTQHAPMLRVLRMASFASWVLCSLPALSAPPRPPARAPAQDSEFQRSLQEGERLFRSGDFKAAREPLEKAVSLGEKEGESLELGRALNLLGSTMRGFGDSPRSLALHRRALEVFRHLGQTEEEAKTLDSIGANFQDTADYPEALKYYQQSFQAAQKARSPGVAGRALSHIGIVKRNLGDYGQATEYLQRALGLQKKAGDLSGVGLTLYYLGIVSRGRGEFERALQFCRESLESYRQAADRRGEAQTLLELSLLHGTIGQPEAAISYSSQALTVAQETGYRAVAGLAELFIGNAFWDLRRLEEARAHTEQALSIFRGINRRSSVGDALYLLGQIRREGDHDFEKARQAYAEMLQLGRELKEPVKQAGALLGLGQTARASGSAQEALSRLDESLELASSSRTPDVEYQVRAERARTLRALGRKEDGLAEFEASARIVNDLRANLKSDPGKVSFLDHRQAVFTDWAEALFEDGRAEQALEVAEAGRARAMADLLAQRRIRGKPRERQILEQFRTTVDTLAASTRAQTGPPTLASTEGSTTRGTALETQLASLRSQNQELASLLTVESPKMEEIRGVAARLGAAIVEYLATESRLFIWVVQPSGGVHSIRKDIARESLASSVKKLRQQIDRADADALQHPETVRPQLRTLDATLFESIEPWLPAADTPVIVVPHGPLWLVPFAALEDVAGKSLAERHTLCFVPSVSVFRYTGGKRASATTAQRALVVADPVPPHGSGLPPLAGSRAEAIQIQTRLGPRRAHLLTGAEASEAAVKRESAGYSILHFATHGLIVEDRPLESSLVLAEGNGEDGYLRVDEVFGLDLKADLVVLSGCSTGLGRLSGDGVLGLTRAFLYAGTRSLVVSQWDVSDRATALVMDRFYAELEAGRSKVAALRAAQLSAKERWPHPALWATFGLVGEPR